MTMDALDPKDKSLKIERTKDNIKKRPNGQKRHDPFCFDDHARRNSDSMIAMIEREWLSLNWRKYRASTFSKSKKRMILIMF